MFNTESIKALAEADKLNEEQLRKELLRHQLPLAGIVNSLIQVLKYQKSLIPNHIINPLITSLQEYINKELETLKN